MVYQQTLHTAWANGNLNPNIPVICHVLLVTFGLFFGRQFVFSTLICFEGVVIIFFAKKKNFITAMPPSTTEVAFVFLCIKTLSNQAWMNI